MKWITSGKRNDRDNSLPHEVKPHTGAFFRKYVCFGRIYHTI